MDLKRTLLVGIGMALLLALACKPATDLNKPCNLVKKGDGGIAFITEGDVQNRLKNHPLDFITFGSVDCEDLTCVRDPSFPAGADLTAPAKGYCSTVCIEGSTCRSFDDSYDKDPATALTCRALLLDAATLGAICNKEDGGASDCAAVGNASQPFFCARGSSAFDAGI